MTEWMTSDEVAAEIRTTTNYVSRQCAIGNLKAKKLGNEWRIRRSDLNAFMAGEEKTPASRPLSARQRRRSA